MKVLKLSDYPVGVRVAGTGYYLPDRIVPNSEIAGPLTETEIVRLSGIHTRRFAATTQATSDLAIAAGRVALADARVDSALLDRLIVGTVSPDHSSPSSACFVHRGLGLPPLPAFDITASCSAWTFLIDQAARAIITGDDRVLIVAADIRSRVVDPQDRGTFALFGDGAGACVLERGPKGSGLLAVGVSSDGVGAESVYVPAGGSRKPIDSQALDQRLQFLKMAEGPQVYFAAVDGMLRIAQALLDACGLTLSDVDLVVPHQPNRRILDRLAKLAGWPTEKLWINVDRLGNMSGASCAVAFAEARAAGRMRAGQKILVVTGGAGYTAGAALFVEGNTHD